MLTALAVAPTSQSVNKARRMIQFEVAKVALPPVPSALTLAGPAPNLKFPNSNPYKINGNDDPACGTTDNKPAIGTVTDQPIGSESPTDVATDARNTVINALPRPDHYVGVDACSNGQPDVQNVSNTVNSLYSTVSGLNGIVHDIQGAATQTFGNNPTIPDLGVNAPKITVVNGDFTFGPVTGSGILLVTGNLTLQGNFSFTGVVLVIGSGSVTAKGGGNGQINGAMVVANIGNSSYATNPVDANLLPNLGSPTFDFSGGGGNGIQYNSCSIVAAGGAANYTVVARREITY